MFIGSFPNLETLTPSIDIDPTHINPGLPPPSSFIDQPWPGGTTISMVGPAYCAGLSKRSVPVLPGLLTGVRQITYSFEILISETGLLYCQVIEDDLRPVDDLGYLYPGDVQKNLAAGGMWDYSPDGYNRAPSQIVTPPWEPDIWTPVEKVHEVDFTKHTIALMSIADDGKVYPNPNPVAVPAIPGLGWPGNFFYLQDQRGRNGAVGNLGFETSLRNISISIQ